MRQLTFFVLLVPLLLAAQSGGDELVTVKELIPDIVLEVKYNTVDNFTGQKLYTTDECLLARSVVQRLIIVQDSLRNIRQHDGKSYPAGLGLKIFDGYRPRAVQYLMWEIVPDPIFVADPNQGSSHNRGAAVDLTLVDRATGEELEMPTPFDDFSEAAGHNYTDLPPHIIANRQLLRDIMTGVGNFGLYSAEWWHYSYGPATGFPLLDFQMK